MAAGWDLAAVFTQAGLDDAWLDRVTATMAEAASPSGDLVGSGSGPSAPGWQGGGGADSGPIGDDDNAASRDAGAREPGRGSRTGSAAGADLDGALRWLGYTVESELLMNEIADSVTRISALVDAAKQYSQLDRAPYQVVDVHELLDSTLVMLGGKIPPGITVARDYDRGLPRIPGYPGELNQVWTNLIDNAVAAMGETGTLTVRTALDRDHDQLLAEFGDTGPGIPPEIKERIFEPFFTTKAVGEGTGLGLDISWRIVVGRHHGDLRVESVPGDTRFAVRLPLTAPEGRAEEGT